MMVTRSFAMLMTSVACAAPEFDRQKTEFSEPHQIAACAAALDAVSLEAEKSYRAALTATAVRDQRAALPVENVSARRALNTLELALVETRADGSLERAARRFTSAAEALLLRIREPLRRSGDGGLRQTESLQALLSMHDLFEDAAAHLRTEVERAVRSHTLLEVMRRGPRARAPLSDNPACRTPKAACTQLNFEPFGVLLEKNGLLHAHVDPVYRGEVLDRISRQN